MLNEADAVATVAVKDLEIAKKFYQEKLGLTLLGNDDEEVLVFKSGNSRLNVYRSEYAGTNQATAVTWAVTNIEETVRTLKDKGVTFEHYDMPGMTHEGDIHVAQGIKVAWFKDLDGNILNVIHR